MGRRVWEGLEIWVCMVSRGLTEDLSDDREVKFMEFDLSADGRYRTRKRTI